MRAWPSWLRLVLVRCGGCGRRNAVDVQRALSGGWPRCGSCRGRLPRRLPGGALVAGLGVLVVVAVVAAAAAAVAGRHLAQVRRARSLELVARGEVAEAAALLPGPPRSPEDAAWAEELARGAGARVLRTHGRLEADLRAVEAALADGDRLVARHGQGWPELVTVLDPALRDLARRRRLLRGLRDLEAAAAPADLADAARRVQAAAAELPPAEAGAFAAPLTPSLARAALVAARAHAAGGRWSEVREALARAPLPEPGPRATDEEPEPPVGDVAIARGMLDDMRAAAGGADVDRLARLARARWAADLPAALREELTRAQLGACGRLAAEAGRLALAEEEPAARERWLALAATCDEALPRDVVARLQVAIARARTDLALAGGSTRPAVSAWRAAGGADRDAALAALACDAERRGRPVEAVEAWLAVGPGLPEVFGCPDASGR